MASSRTSTAAVFGWSGLGVFLVAVLLYGAWPVLFGPFAGPPSAVTTAAELDPQTADALRRAATLLGRGPRLEALSDDPRQLEQAASLLAGVLDRRPDLAEAHYLAGLLALAEERPEEARVALGRGLERDPDHLSSLLALGASWARQEDHAAAEEVFRRAVELHPESTAALDNLGQTLWLLGRRDEALEVYRRKIEIRQRGLEVASPVAR